MQDDLVARLRVNDAEIYLPILGQAADRIAALEADNARLREALEQFLSLIEYQYCGSREAYERTSRSRQFRPRRTGREAMTDVAEIAGRLSEAQRRLVLASGPDDVTGEEGLGVDLTGPMYRTAQSLHGLGIGDYTHGSPIADMYWNRPLGLAVRAYLENSRVTD